MLRGERIRVGGNREERGDLIVIPHLLRGERVGVEGNRANIPPSLQNNSLAKGRKDWGGGKLTLADFEKACMGLLRGERIGVGGNIL